MFAETLPLLKKYPEEPYKRIINKAFTAFPRDVGFNNGLSAPQPDYAEGLEMAEFLPVPIDEHISGAVLYGDTPRAVTLPHLAGEWKGRRGDMDEATLQSAYDGAALVYARNQAMAYQGRSDDAGHAHITTFTTDGTHVNLYAHYAVSTEDGTMQYHQYPIGSTSLVNSFGEFEQGRKQLRNLQDRAREQSYALKEELRVYYTQQRLNGGGGSLQPVAENDIPSSCAAVSALATEPQFASGDQNNRDHDQDHGHNEGISADQPMLSSSFKQDSGKTRSPSSSHHKPSLSHSSKTGSSTHGSVHNRGQKRKASFSHKSAGMRRNGPTNEKTQDD
ncbi:hypothetical protein SCUCBS95973_007178 [Sporothrix curviconia]|uniref:DUF7924 domain-containing protein n=1 Tax=Sporothrix curviconia TaxID=1260050 RepID=A0ABP0CB70_9PEZI